MEISIYTEKLVIFIEAAVAVAAAHNHAVKCIGTKSAISLASQVVVIEFFFITTRLSLHDSCLLLS